MPNVVPRGYLQGIQKYIQTEILGIYGAPNYRNIRKAYKQLENQGKTRKQAKKKTRKTYEQTEKKEKNK